MKLHLLWLLTASAIVIPHTDSKERVAYIIASSSGNLPSAARDVTTYYDIFTRMGFSVEMILDVSPKELQTIRTHISTDTIHTDLNDFPELISHHDVDTDVIVTISGHGYDNYIKFNGISYNNQEISTWIKSSKAHVFVMIDTCHSGNLCPIPSKNRERIHVLTACSSSEMDNDDISTEFGFGGGLTASFADYISCKNEIDLEQLYEYCRQRLALANQHPVFI